MSAAYDAQVTTEYLLEFHGNPLVIGASCFIVINTIFVTLRFVSRYFQHIGWRVDDLLVSLSWLLNVAFCAVEIGKNLISCDSIATYIADQRAVHVKVFGAGHHIKWYQYRPELYAGFSIISFYAQPMIYCVAVVAPRLAVLILYYNIFVKKWMRVVCCILGSMMAALMIADIFTVAFMCSPHAKAWEADLSGHCIQIETFYIWGTFPNFVFDFFIMLLPLPMLWRLHSPIQVKIGLLATFAVGSAGIVTSIIRWAAYFDDHFVTDDAPWSVNPLEFWMMTEITAYLMCACLLTLRPLLRKINQTKFATWIHDFLLQCNVCSSLARRNTSSKPARDSIDKNFSSGLPYAVS